MNLWKTKLSSQILRQDNKIPRKRPLPMENQAFLGKTKLSYGKSSFARENPPFRVKKCLKTVHFDRFPDPKTTKVPFTGFWHLLGVELFLAKNDVFCPFLTIFSKKS